MSLDLSGLLGVWLMIVIAGSYALICLVTSVFSLFYHKYGTEIVIKRSSLRLIYASLAIVIVDILFIFFFVSDYLGEPYLEGETLDWFAIYIWLPIHFVAIILIAFLIWQFNRNKQISK